MKKRTVTTEMRLIALEYLVMNLYVLIHRRQGSTPEMVLQAHEQAREKLRAGSIPGIDAVQSDVAMQEIEEAVDGLLVGIEEMLGIQRK